jgi:S1-C subfamily serine protease
MNSRSYRYGLLIVAVVVALLVGLGPGWRGAAALAQYITPSSISTPAEVTAVAPLVEERPAAFALEEQIIAVYDAASPAVVNITSRSYTTDMFMGTVPQSGTGSGFVYDRLGHIVTNFHVVEDAEEVTVTFSNGQSYKAEIVGTDPINDLAVIRIDAGDDLPDPLPVADSDTLKVGQFVLAIGNPFGLDQTLTTGVISALGRVIESPQDNRFIGEAIQTDAAINPGNSGGPMLDLRGQVIGVNSQIISPSGANAGIGFAVSSNTVRRVAPELIAKGKYAHPWLGVQLVTLTPDGLDALREAGRDLPDDAGLLIVEVVEDGPAAKAGVQGASRFAEIDSTEVPLDGDVVLAIDGQAVRTFEDLTVYLETETTAGDTIALTVLRDGAEVVLTVTLGELPSGN